MPAFTGLGAPYWDPHARGAIFGLTRAASRADIVRAALEGIAFQTHDLLSAMSKDGVVPTTLRVDGGMVANDWFLQTLSNITNINVERPSMLETTALGAARLAIMGLNNNGSTLKNETATKFHQTAPKWQAEHRKARIEPVSYTHLTLPTKA